MPHCGNIQVTSLNFHRDCCLKKKIEEKILKILNSDYEKFLDESRQKIPKNIDIPGELGILSKQEFVVTKFA